MSEVENKQDNNATEPAAEEPIPGLIKSDGLINDFDSQLEVMQSDPNSPLYSVKSFDELGLKPELLKGVYAMGYNKPSKIQETALPVIINSNENLIAQSQSGTGKTAAFTLGMLNTVDTNLNAPQAICFSPTKELALQIFEVISNIGKFSSIKPLLYIPEVDLPNKIENQIIIGTPGKLFDGITRRKILTKHVKMIVLDEADFIVASRGMQQQIGSIKQFLPQNTKVCLFSATFSLGVDQLISAMVPDPKVSLRIKRLDLSVDKIHQYYIDCDSESNKAIILSDIYGYISVGQSIVFAHTIETAKKLAEMMRADGHSISLLYGKDLSTEERFKQIKDFKEGRTKVLITTNVLARGIDILQVSLVINYDIPLDENSRPDPVSYLHRVGRVGRFGRSGVAISFVHDESSKKKLNAISEHLGRQIKELKSTEIESLDGILKGLKDLTPLAK
ncbi:hypothetical protein CYY_007584 [Polysphondylium violaceum]|uniref:ATP-dependent RNA helicase n=1 Tax=Polysphondylium violaceum TaxID=133409 RepID=A0A8J4UXX7_9MYCE|nr:hypothetical protein CYY_007584 [Polysphondylium violaceum]